MPAGLRAAVSYVEGEYELTLGLVPQTGALQVHSSAGNTPTLLAAYLLTNSLRQSTRLPGRGWTTPADAHRVRFLTKIKGSLRFSPLSLRFGGEQLHAAILLATKLLPRSFVVRHFGTITGVGGI